jgi:cell division protein FtsL
MCFVLITTFIFVILFAALKLLHLQVHSRGVNIQIVEQTISQMEQCAGGERTFGFLY